MTLFLTGSVFDDAFVDLEALCQAVAVEQGEGKEKKKKDDKYVYISIY